jgi:hypothetical protein
MDEMANIPAQLTPDPPSSPDLAPSDFFLFGYLKEKMIDQEFDSSEDLITWIKATFAPISKRVIE